MRSFQVLILEKLSLSTVIAIKKESVEIKIAKA